jgi:hypothetical protein
MYYSSLAIIKFPWGTESIEIFAIKKWKMFTGIPFLYRDRDMKLEWAKSGMVWKV